MSFTPSRGEIVREAFGAHEVEAELKAREYAHLHPETDYPIEKRPHRLLHRLRAVLGRKQDSD